MKHTYQLKTNQVALSLTKPATRFGVPFDAFFTSIIFCMFGWLVTQVMTSLSSLISAAIFAGIWFGIYLFMFIKSKNDIFGLLIYSINLTHFRRSKSYSFWGNTDSYSS